MKNIIYILLATLSLTTGKLMADPTDDSLATITSIRSQTEQMVLVSAEELGFKDTTVLTWSAVLDSASKHGYRVCPRQSGLDLYILLLRVNIANVPACNPIYIGMNEVSKMGDTSHYVYCLKTKGSTIDYKLGYASINDTNNKFKLITSDMFVFEQIKY